MDSRSISLRPPPSATSRNQPSTSPREAVGTSGATFSTSFSATSAHRGETVPASSAPVTTSLRGSRIAPANRATRCASPGSTRVLCALTHCAVFAAVDCSTTPRPSASAATATRNTPARASNAPRVSISSVSPPSPTCHNNSCASASRSVTARADAVRSGSRGTPARGSSSPLPGCFSNMP
nr:hypothetical protein [Segeticoccus sp.]